MAPLLYSLDAVIVAGTASNDPTPIKIPVLLSNGPPTGTVFSAPELLITLQTITPSLFSLDASIVASVTSNNPATGSALPPTKSPYPCLTAMPTGTVSSTPLFLRVLETMLLSVCSLDTTVIVLILILEY
ncbi:hypothetical protein ARMGADRAFT_1083468 [Armillaria gallica]|uniref:Uncharacterized protein n=1 Tax=Armillaria gallica TaxID=47427 RepID=A0A2H3D2H1_ARMGA|nr:hypothetical protein ARMGADRAFT_1083468 [Armillaria gallica]